MINEQPEKLWNSPEKLKVPLVQNDQLDWVSHWFIDFSIDKDSLFLKL